MPALVEQETVRSDHRIAALDGIRGLAILIVTLYRFASPAFPESLVGSLMHRATYLGTTGVDLFFVLSGFLITGILLDSRSRPDYFRRFYFRRALRIFPLYYATLFVLLVILPFAFSNRTIIDLIQGNPAHLWIYTSNLEMAWTNGFHFGALDHFWSLAIEEQFYLFWPIVVFCVSPKWLSRLALTLLVMFVAARIGSSVCNIGEVTERTFTFFRCDGLLLGALAAMFVRKQADISCYHLHARLAFVIAVILFGMSLVLGRDDFTVRYTLVSLLWCALLLSVVSSRAGTMERRIFEMAPLRVLGKYSYAMYVFQTPLIPLLSFYISPEILNMALANPYWGGLAYVVIMFAITLAVAVLSWHSLEKQCLRFRDWSPQSA